MKVHLDFDKPHWNAVSGFFMVLFLILAVTALVYLLMYNPHKSVHSAVLKTAENIQSFYRDQPGFWKLSTQSAHENKLDKPLARYAKEYDIQIGQGLDGAMSLPSDQNFNIVLKNLNESACINLTELPTSGENLLMLQKITIINESGETEFSWGGENGLPIKKYAARKVCLPTDNAIVWTFL